uniref:Uncharacterized protein n=1 Tax=Meloidogyne enterolobii TaxID=390850 RepID=A0A6V7VMB0_MELEN|nr:unnamed protein product [Meloidogyne enterolobii]
MNKLFDQQKQPPELNLINGFEGEESKEFNNLSDIEQNKVQMEAVAAAAAFLLSFPSENPTNSKISQINGKEEKQNSSFKTIIRHPPLQPISQKGNRWIHLGTFETEEEMHRVRNKEKVSKRRTEQLKNGVKIRYRCNTWKRTKCAFQMFSFFNPSDGLIDLYECGEHDHSGRRKLEYELYGPIRNRNSTTNLPIPKEFINLNLNKINKPKKSKNENISTKTMSFPLFSLFNDIEKTKQLFNLSEDFGMKLCQESENKFSIQKIDKNGNKKLF